MKRVLACLMILSLCGCMKQGPNNNDSIMDTASNDVVTSTTTSSAVVQAQSLKDYVSVNEIERILRRNNIYVYEEELKDLKYGSDYIEVDFTHGSLIYYYDGTYEAAFESPFYYYIDGSVRMMKAVASFKNNEVEMMLAGSTNYPVKLDLETLKLTDNEEGSSTFGKEMQFYHALNFNSKNILYTMALNVRTITELIYDGLLESGEGQPTDYLLVMNTNADFKDIYLSGVEVDYPSGQPYMGSNVTYDELKPYAYLLYYANNARDFSDALYIDVIGQLATDTVCIRDYCQVGTNGEQKMKLGVSLNEGYYDLASISALKELYQYYFNTEPKLNMNKQTKLGGYLSSALGAYMYMAREGDGPNEISGVYVCNEAEVVKAMKQKQKEIKVEYFSFFSLDYGLDYECTEEELYRTIKNKIDMYPHYMATMKWENDHYILVDNRLKYID